MSLGTGRVGLYGASAGGGTGVTATLTSSATGSFSTTITISLSEGATLVSWTLRKREKLTPEASWSSWSNVATGITASEYDVTGLEPSPAQYEFQAVDVVTETTTTSNVVSVATAVYTGDNFRAITNSLTMNASPFNSSDPISYLYIIKNTDVRPVTKIRLRGSINGAGTPAQIQAAWVGTGSVNVANYTATNVIPITFGGNASFSPSAGVNNYGRSYWYSDVITLPNALTQNEMCVIRCYLPAGYNYTLYELQQSKRATYMDLVRTARGYNQDLASTLAIAQAAATPGNEDWPYMPFNVDLLYASTGSQEQRACLHGDSLVTGFDAANPNRDKWAATANGLFTMGRRIDSMGISGSPTINTGDVVQQWLQTEQATHYDSVGICGFSVNSYPYADPTASFASLDAAYNAIITAGKRPFVVFWAPPGGGATAPQIALHAAYRANATTKGYRIIDMVDQFIDVDGKSWKAGMSSDQSHMSQTAQTIAGQQLAANESVIFG